MGHAEPVPTDDLQKSPKDTFYLPMHAVRKEHSTTTKVRVVFDASAKSASSVSLNDTLLVGPTVHPPSLMFFSDSDYIAWHLQRTSVKCIEP